jgi:elongation factor P--(R)-beta-lysine ligase
MHPQMSSDDPCDWQPTASLEVLEQRAVLISAMRRVFEEAGYWEVETPILSHDIVVDAHLDPFITRYFSERLPQDSNSGGQELFLQTSPEFAMKRLLAAGAKAIYQITRVMRNGERGGRHNPEFTMAEWYRTGDDHHAQMDFTEHLVREVFAEAVNFRKEVALPKEPFERLAYNKAFERYAGCEVLDMETAEFAELAEAHDLTPPESLAPEDRDGWLNFLLANIVEPELGEDRPTFLYDYPATQAALARVRPDDPPVAERFELYMSGMEICNGYHELTDTEEFEARMRKQNLLRRTENARPLPETNRLLAAMRAGLPNSAGVALGVDRLIMLALGLSSIDQVIAFPFPRA